MRHLLSLTELETEDLSTLIARSCALATGVARPEARLRGKTVGILFLGPSTRTRTSFTVAAQKLGAATVTYGPADLQLTTGETLEDTGRVLASFLDALVVRTNGPVADMQALAKQGRMAVINAMSSLEHPTQAIADFSVLKEAFGDLSGRHLLYLGEGNNSAAALAFAGSRIPGFRVSFYCPQDFGLPPEQLQAAHEQARACGAEIVHSSDVSRLPTRVDAVYATRWQTMGAPKAIANWEERFQPFSITAELMAKVSKPEGTIFLHDLPAVRGMDVADEVLDGPQSWAFHQVKHKLTAAMAVLEWCLIDR